MSLLHDKQVHFAWLVGQLLLEAQMQGYGVTLGEAWRSKPEAERLAKAGKGIKNSLHCQRLAIDLNLFRDDVYLTDTESYRPLGEWWEQQDRLCRWGGRFPRPDGNHFEMRHP